MRPIVVTVCGDPGGANAISPVLQLLADEHQVQLINYSYNQAVGVLQRNNINTIPLLSHASEDFALNVLRKYNPLLLLTATSVNEKDWEKLFIFSARKLSIYSIAIVDFWSNYAARFSDKKGSLCSLPNKIALMDEFAKTEIMADGIPAERIIITGQPAFDALMQHYEQFTQAKKQAIRMTLEVSDNDLLVMFVSQPLRKLYGDRADPRYLGYDEDSTLNYIISSLEDICRTDNKKITFLIRPHPQESVVEYRQYQSNMIKIVVSVEGNNRDYVMAADLVLGMTSVLLVEACYLKCVVLSLQLGLCKSDVLPTNRWGVSIPIYREDEVLPMLKKYLFDHKAREAILAKELAISNSASRQVVDYVYSEIKQFQY